MVHSDDQKRDNIVKNYEFYCNWITHQRKRVQQVARPMTGQGLRVCHMSRSTLLDNWLQPVQSWCTARRGLYEHACECKRSFIKHSSSMALKLSPWLRVTHELAYSVSIRVETIQPPAAAAVFVRTDSWTYESVPEASWKWMTGDSAGLVLLLGSWWRLRTSET